MVNWLKHAYNCTPFEKFTWFPIGTIFFSHTVMRFLYNINRIKIHFMQRTEYKWMVLIYICVALCGQSIQDFSRNNRLAITMFALYGRRMCLCISCALKMKFQKKTTVFMIEPFIGSSLCFHCCFYDQIK